MTYLFLFYRYVIELPMLDKNHLKNILFYLLIAHVYETDFHIFSFLFLSLFNKSSIPEWF